MASYLKKIGNDYNIPVNFFECDTDTDLQSIDTTYVIPCSEVYVIDSGNTYVLNTNKEWKLKPSSGGGGSGGGETDYIYDGGAPADSSGDTVIYDGGQI